MPRLLLLSLAAALLSGCGLDGTLILPDAAPDAVSPAYSGVSPLVWVSGPSGGEDPVRLFTRAGVDVVEVITRPRTVCRGPSGSGRGRESTRSCPSVDRVQRGTIHFVRIDRADLSIAQSLGYSERSP